MALKDDDVNRGEGLKSLRSQVIAVNCTDAIIKLIREALLTRSIIVDTDRFTIQDNILKYLDKIWVLKVLRTGLIQEVYD